MNYQYNFPEKDLFRALEITEPEFKIQSKPEWFKRLWVDFSPVRSNKYIAQMKRLIGMEGNKLVHIPNIYKKIIFSGHKGSGKSVELSRLANEINHPEGFFVIFIDLEKETNIQQLSSEDIFVVLITLLIRKLEENNVYFIKDALSDIAEDFLVEKSVVKELKDNFDLDIEGSVGGGWNFWNFFKAQGNLKSVFSHDNILTKTIRRKIKNNPKPLIEKFNASLVQIRKEIKDEKKGKDIIFFIDGLEKANRNVYENLFINDVQLLTSLNVHIISTVPIDTYYKIIEQGNRFNFNDFYLPMIRISDKSKELFKEMIYKRIDVSLIDDDAIDYLIEYSGGCPRILLKLINRSLLETDQGKITKQIAEIVVIKEGNERYRTLTSKHKELIKKGDFNSADPVVIELLHSLTILEYNGLNPERKLNPVLNRFFQ